MKFLKVYYCLFVSQVIFVSETEYNCLELLRNYMMFVGVLFEQVIVVVYT